MTIPHVYAPKATAKVIETGVCHDCKKRTRFINLFTPWFGWDSTCLRCGRSWQDGEWMNLEFTQNSRQKSINIAKSIWRSMPPVSENHYGIEL